MPSCLFQLINLISAHKITKMHKWIQFVEIIKVFALSQYERFLQLLLRYWLQIYGHTNHYKSSEGISMIQYHEMRTRIIHKSLNELYLFATI